MPPPLRTRSPPSSLHGSDRSDDYDTNVAVRVLLVDPQPFFCEALAAALGGSADLEVVGWTTDELEADRLASQRSAEVVLTEVELAGGSGLSLTRRLAGGPAVVVLTRGHEGDVLLDAVAAGGMGCLSHHLEPDDLVRHVVRAADGEFAIDHGRLHEELRRASAARSPKGAGSQKLALLTAREREVLALLARGLDNQAIALRLHLSAHTARTHVGNILRKLGVHSRADAARIALREGQAEGDTHVLRIRGPDLGPG
jgi:DNA-binding NarL/FixJ family response regulator